MLKKGVSPLIATVLLVMIVVSIGAAVMVVIQSISNEQLQATTVQQSLIQCGVDVAAEILEVNDNSRVCIFTDPTQDNGTISLYMENTGTKDITGWQMRVVGSGGISSSSTQGVALARGGLSLMKFNFSGVGSLPAPLLVSEIDQIRLSPLISGGSNSPLIACDEPNLVWDSDVISRWTTCDTVTWD